MRVAYFGTWERGHPRNDQTISALRRAGVDVRLIHREAWKGTHKFGLGATAIPRLLGAEVRLSFTRLPDATDAVIVGYPGQFDIPAARLRRRPLVFNPMVSLYDSLVDDRHRFRPDSLAARVLRQVDIRSFRAADLVVADTRAHAEFMAAWAGIDLPAVCFVGAEERLFKAMWRRDDDFHVLFVGKLIPLHGVDLILEAARLVPEIRFRIVGSGQLDHLLRDRPPNVEHTDWIEYERLPEAYASAGCALGIFGSSAKAGRVIPNKAFQALAVGTPLVTADTAATRELLGDGRDALLVQRSPEALAHAVRRIRDDADLAERLGRGGRGTFEREASEQVLGVRWRTAVEQAVAGRG